MFDLAWVNGEVDRAKPRVRFAFRNYVEELRAANPRGFTELRGAREAAARYGSGLQAIYIELAFAAAARANTQFDPTWWKALRDLTDFQTVAAVRMADDQRLAVDRARQEADPRSRSAAAFQALGITHAQVGYVEHYRALLAEEDGPIDRMVENFATKQLETREDLVTTTEGTRAVHAVGFQILHQMVDRGELDSNNVEREWASHEDSRPSHKGMNGQVRRGLIGTFTSGDGADLRYPVDARAPLREIMGCNCRQVIRLRS